MALNSVESKELWEQDPWTLELVERFKNISAPKNQIYSEQDERQEEEPRYVFGFTKMCHTTLQTSSKKKDEAIFFTHKLPDQI